MRTVLFLTCIAAASIGCDKSKPVSKDVKTVGPASSKTSAPVDKVPGTDTPSSAAKKGSGGTKTPGTPPAKAVPARPSKAPSKPPKPAPAKPTVSLDAEVAGAVKAATTCDLTSMSSAFKCEAHKKALEILKNVLKDGKRAAGVIETLSVLVHDADPKVVEAARFYIAQASSMYVFPKLVKAGGKVTLGTAQRMVKALEQSPAGMATRLAASVTATATLGGATAALYAAVDGHRDKKVVAAMTRALMEYGGMATFDRVKTAAKSDNSALREAALAAPRRMRKWSDDDSTTLCPWALSHFRDESLAVAGQVAHLMVRCKLRDDGAYVDAMIVEGKRRVAAGQWKKPFVWAYRDVCFGGFMGADKKPAPAVCQKNYDFLEWVANQDKVEPWFRGFALSMIYYQRRDKTTYDLLKRYKKSKLKEVAEMVARDMASLEKHYLKEGK